MLTDIPVLFLKNQKLVKDVSDLSVISENPYEYTQSLSDKGVNKLLIHILPDNDAEHDKDLTTLRNIIRNTDAAVYGTGGIKRLEDVKKLLYAGCSVAVLDLSVGSNAELIEEASKRFTKDKLYVMVSEEKQYEDNKDLINEYVSGIITSGVPLSHDNASVYKLIKDVENHSFNINIDCKYKWSDFKKNSDGHVPVVVQDYKADQVLMVAYMNEEAFNKTIETGIMTYFSRSRNELWVKGETSGHYQYVKSMYVDCDSDTILVKVRQIGNACHTGSYSCFFNEAFKLGNDTYNPAKVFNDVYNVILDRKANPKEGSYTNYLFDKGIDKILKKVGEEATEIVIAAKNPDKEEIKYEIADFLYHAMVLMAEKGVTWEDITEELANR